MKKTLLMSATGLIAGTLLLASPVVSSADSVGVVQLAQTTTNSMDPAGPLPDTTLARPEYEIQMQTYLDSQSRSIEELRTGTSSMTEDQLNDMTSSWQDIQTQWDNSRAADESDWPAARDSLNDSLTTFNGQYGGSLGGGSGAGPEAGSLGDDSGSGGTIQ